jgi:hypothetical protein
MLQSPQPSLPSTSLLTYRYAPNEGSPSRIGWKPPHISAYGAVLEPARLVAADDPSARHVINASELFDVQEGSEIHQSIRFDPQFVEATRVEIAADEGRLVEPEPSRPSPPDPNMWRAPEEDPVWREALGPPSRSLESLTIPRRMPRGRGW